MNTNQEFSYARKVAFVILVNLMIPLGGMSTDVYLPSLPAMALHFGVSRAMVQVTVTSFVLAMGLCQLVAGPISDALGRKRLLLLSFIIQLITVFLILHTRSIYLVIVLRFIQGFGVAFMMVPARAVITDIFEKERAKRHFNYITMSFALGPIVAPFIGGYLQHYFGWRANFHFILIYAFICLIGVICILKESIQQKTHFILSNLWRNYQTILNDSVFVSGAILVGLMMTFSTLFMIVAPFIIQNALQLSSIVYGHMALLVGLAWFLGNMLNRLIFNVSKRSKASVAFGATLIASVVMFIAALNGHLSLFSLSAPTFIAAAGCSVIFASYVSECLTMFPSLSASANACLFGIVWLVYGGITVIGTFLRAQTLLPLASAYLALTIIIIAYYLFFVRKHGA